MFSLPGLQDPDVTPGPFALSVILTADPPPLIHHTPTTLAYSQSLEHTELRVFTYSVSSAFYVAHDGLSSNAGAPENPRLSI